MSPEVIEIVVYDAPAARQKGCDCGCDHHGPDAAQVHGHRHAHGDAFANISMEMQTRALGLTLEKEFPGKVRVEYMNVLADPRWAALPQTKLLCSLTYPSPLVYVNGRGRFAGALPVERIREEVQTLLAAKTA
jgi:hypothetical protein|uniref:Thioredoxin family protein n=1 Tax=Desulfobacca acetoxidans TaxID=60893 RepID=A0A7V6DQD8_9BACT